MLILNLGRRRVGKTTLAYKIISNSETRVIWDPRGLFHTSSCVLSGSSGLYEALDNEYEIIIKPERDVKGTFDSCCSVLWRWVKDNPEAKVSFLVDEAYFIETSNTSYESFDAMLRFSGEGQLKIVITAHRPADIGTSIRSIADKWCMFRTTQEHDLKVIRERCGEIVAEQVANLKPYQYVVWDDGISSYEVKLEPAKWYISMKQSRSVSNETKSGNA